MKLTKIKTGKTKEMPMTQLPDSVPILSKLLTILSPGLILHKVSSCLVTKIGTGSLVIK